MRLLTSLFKSSKSSGFDDLHWNHLNTIEELNDLTQRSLKKPQLIFKHSVNCGISKMVLQQFVRDYSNGSFDFDLNFVVVQTARPVSNAIAASYDIQHESPQLIVIQDNKVLIHASHGAINSIDLSEF